ncbi:protein NRT1/ PTR FAMILY 5.6-like isoform X1 [Papaver somniferum]|uniref:protein NRT1/ PTR FAMILY 5.6-like isoform X1 n=3 Tax=Papaver somniferum TaxID=3469 RepID=UPI000E6FB463|nr:protein NRT1/ PTR FAMILY 5.6-like isoform X1 [Papaver somniferum]
MDEQKQLVLVGMDYDAGAKDDKNLETINQKQWVNDSSVDHKGRRPLRASTGVWKAALFIIAIEFGERLSYFVISTNLIVYLTKVVHQDLKTAAKNVNYWSGVTTMMPLLGGFLADAYFGRFWMVLISSTIYVLGLILLTMSELIPGLKPCDVVMSGSSTTTVCHHRSPKVHEVVFFIAIYLISIGTGGHKPSLESFGADQFDENHAQERKKKMSYFNWWNFGLCSGLILGVTVVAHIQQKISWAAGDIIITVVMIATIVVFCAGRPFYRYRKAKQGSPLSPMIQVIVAAIIKRNLPYPSNPVQLYDETNHPTPLRQTDKFRFLDKAGIVEESNKEEIEKAVSSISTQSKIQRNPWRLTTVTSVEELKLLLNMIPIWLTTLTFGICLTQATTFFIKQGTHMNRKIGDGGFELPPASTFCLAAIGMILTICVYDRILVPWLRRLKRNERGINILPRIGIGMAFTMLAMVIAALVERKRLGVAHSSSGKTLMSVFWIAPQFLVYGIGDGFALVGLQEYFYDQSPDSMRSLGIAFYLSVLGVADFLSSILIIVVDRVSGMNGRSSWFGKDMNESRIDNFYWLLAGMNGMNLIVYTLLARKYTYNNSIKNKISNTGSNDHV